MGQFFLFCKLNWQIGYWGIRILGKQVVGKLSGKDYLFTTALKIMPNISSTT